MYLQIKFSKYLMVMRFFPSKSVINLQFLRYAGTIKRKFNIFLIVFKGKLVALFSPICELSSVWPTPNG